MCHQIPRLIKCACACSGQFGSPRGRASDQIAVCVSDQMCTCMGACTAVVPRGRLIKSRASDQIAGRCLIKCAHVHVDVRRRGANDTAHTGACAWAAGVLLRRGALAPWCVEQLLCFYSCPICTSSRNTSPGPTLPPGPAKANCVLKFEYTRALRRGSQTQFVTELCSQKMSDREANAESKSKSRANGELVPMRHALLAVHTSCVLPSRLTPPHTGHVTRTRTRRVTAIQCYRVHGIQL